ncbi:hypothetical protein CBR_g28545 [Chara braunii]|uniref:Uncharacterized protein n=1 Tax=Chara braunii TaxID=69332 RepID=A0A388JWC0_CHABU|nr:hypothetical protein CBR_g28545 [Chara braunii]|eukprot:GBG62068.1 hypothetical protein CBR_g28545 [Chara braunii]
MGMAYDIGIVLPLVGCFGGNCSNAVRFKIRQFRDVNYVVPYPYEPKRPSDDEILQVCGERLGDNSGLTWSFDEMLQLLFCKQQEVNALKSVLDQLQAVHEQSIESMLKKLNLGSDRLRQLADRSKDELIELGGKVSPANVGRAKRKLFDNLDGNQKFRNEYMYDHVYVHRTRSLLVMQDIFMQLKAQSNTAMQENMVRWRERAVSLDLQVRKLLTISDSRGDAVALTQPLFKAHIEDVMREMSKADAMSAIRCLQWLAETFLNRAIMAEVQAALHFSLTRAQEEFTIESFYRLLLNAHSDRKRLADMVVAVQSVTTDFNVHECGYKMQQPSDNQAAKRLRKEILYFSVPTESQRVCSATSMEAKFHNRSVRSEFPGYRSSIVATAHQLRVLELEKQSYLEDMYAEFVVVNQIQGMDQYETLAHIREDDEMPALLSVLYEEQDERFNDDFI